jgi:ribosomal protein S18 acetylase RimI-like enzyme
MGVPGALNARLVTSLKAPRSQRTGISSWRDRLTTVRSPLRAPYSSPPAAVDPPALGLELRCLDWDTRFFGSRMGTLVLTPSGRSEDVTTRLDALDRDLSILLNRARAEGYAHLIFRAPADDLPAAWAAEQAGLRLVDVGIDSTWSPGAAPVQDTSGVPVRSVRIDDLPSLCDLAAESFLLSRFSADPFFTSAQVQAFHREWVKNLCGGLAQGILVCEIEGELAGFITCALSGDEGRIPLIATRAGYRRRGLGRALVGSALRWFAEAGARVAHVKTQAHNYPALTLYHRAGFTVSKTELTFSVTIA